MEQHAVAVRTSNENGDCFFISIYLRPAMTRPTIDGVFAQLEAWLASCLHSRITFIAGDMNTELHQEAIREMQLDPRGTGSRAGWRVVQLRDAVHRLAVVRVQERGHAVSVTRRGRRPEERYMCIDHIPWESRGPTDLEVGRLQVATSRLV